MGTRGAILIAKDKKIKGFYNHYDSYPSGLGEEVISMIQKIDKKKQWEQLKINVDKLKVVKEGTKPSKELQERYKKYSNLNVSERSLEDWYCLLRELQGTKYIEEICAGNVEHMNDGGADFVKDSLFCEYAYLIDLDKMVLELYVGFQNSPQKGNRFGVKGDKRKDSYFPCAKLGEIPLDGISKNKEANKQMLAIYEAYDKAEEAKSEAEKVK